jgi:hypothetical protein
MATKRKSKAKPKRATTAQSNRFIKKARELGVDETGAEFDRLFKRVVAQKEKAR